MTWLQTTMTTIACDAYDSWLVDLFMSTVYPVDTLYTAVLQKAIHLVIHTHTHKRTHTHTCTSTWFGNFRSDIRSFNVALRPDPVLSSTTGKPRQNPNQRTALHGHTPSLAEGFRV